MSLADIKLLTQPHVHSGEHCGVERWTTWSFMMRAYCAAMAPSLGELMGSAGQQETARICTTVRYIIRNQFYPKPLSSKNHFLHKTKNLYFSPCTLHPEPHTLYPKKKPKKKTKTPNTLKTKHPKTPRNTPKHHKTPAFRPSTDLHVEHRRPSAAHAPREGLLKPERRAQAVFL